MKAKVVDMVNVGLSKMSSSTSKRQRERLFENAVANTAEDGD